VTTYRGGAEHVGAGSVTLWTAQQCQWVQEVCDVEANAVEETEVAQEDQEEVVQAVQAAAQEEAAEVERREKKSQACWGGAG
jgi:hypothetical protein